MAALFEEDESPLADILPGARRTPRSSIVVDPSARDHFRGGFRSFRREGDSGFGCGGERRLGMHGCEGVVRESLRTVLAMALESGWEWDDGHAVHSLPAPIETPQLFP